MERDRRKGEVRRLRRPRLVAARGRGPVVRELLFVYFIVQVPWVTTLDATLGGAYDVLSDGWVSYRNIVEYRSGV